MGMIISRVTAMALFALRFKFYIFPVVAFHWGLMTIWLVSQKTQFCETKTEERFFCGVIALIHIFCFFNIKEERTRFRLFVFHTLIFLENSTMIALWYYYSDMYIDHRYGFLALIVVWGGFFAGIVTMLIYYRCFHPNNLSQHSEIDGSLIQTCTKGADSYQDVPDGNTLDEESSERYVSTFNGSTSARCRGNLFTKSGRRHLYWVDGPRQGSTQRQRFIKEDENIHNGRGDSDIKYQKLHNDKIIFENEHYNGEQSQSSLDIVSHETSV